MFAVEVVDNTKAFKSGQKDNDGNPLPLGSIEVKIGSFQSNLGQIRSVFARPLHYNKRVPLIGELVLVVSAPSNDWSNTNTKNIGYYYLCPINSTDDLTFHVFPNLFKRSNNTGAGSSGQRDYDKEKWTKTFTDPKRVFPLQPFEGDDIFEGRTGQSIRFTSTIMGNDSIYEKKASWKGTTKNDPLMILRINKSTNSGTQSTNKYEVEDIETDESSIYLTSTQKLPKLKGGFDKNLTVKQLGTFSNTSQIVINSGRVVINALKEKLLLVGKEQVIVTGKEVILQSDKYKVNLDDLIDYIKAHVDFFAEFTSGQSPAASAAGPTGPTTHVAQVTKLKTADFQKFKLP